jgi:hypothetical protein
VAGLGGWLGYPGRPNAHHGRAPGRYRALAVAVVGVGCRDLQRECRTKITHQRAALGAATSTFNVNLTLFPLCNLRLMISVTLA